jgi:hypothetical protein
MDGIDEVPGAQPKPAKRKALAITLVAAGLLGGAMLGGALPAGAQTATESPAATDSPAAGDDDSRERGTRDGKDCPGRTVPTPTRPPSRS